MRRLAYSDRFTDYLVNSLTSDTVGDNVDNEVLIADGQKTYLVLEVDRQIWRSLFDCVISGADLLYQDTAHEVTWYLWKAAKMGTFCEQVANCVLSDSGTQAAIEKVLVDNQYTGGEGNKDAPLSADIRAENWIVDSCDNDILWSSCRNLVDTVCDATLEVLQRVHAATNDTELLGELLDAIPFIGGMLSLAADVANWASDVAYDAFVVADSANVRDEIACYLFCLGQENCEVNMNNLQSAFSDNAIEHPPWVASAEDNLKWLIDVILAGSPDRQIVCTIGLLGFIAVKYGGKFGSYVIGYRTFQQSVALGAASPSSAWETLCDPCDRIWSEEFLLTDAEAPFQFGEFSGYATGYYDPGVGFRSVLIPPVAPENARTFLAFGFASEVEFNITYMGLTFDWFGGGYANNTYIAQALQADSGDLVSVQYADASNGDDQVLEWSGSNTTKNVNVYMRPSDGINPPAGFAIATRLEVRGVGFNPFREWQHIQDFETDGLGLFTIITGSYVAGVGIVHEDDVNDRRGVVFTLPETGEFTKLSTVIEYTKGTAIPTATAFSYRDGSAVAFDRKEFSEVSSGSQSYSWEGLQAISTNLRTSIFSDNTASPHVGSVTVKSMVLTGKGANPFI